MKNLLTLLIASLITINLSLAQTSVDAPSEINIPEACDLSVKLINLSSDDGQLMVSLYDSSDTWLKNGIQSEITTIENGTATIVFKNVPYGTYAISSIHDVDMDGKLKTGAFGIPSEPYASSRGAKGRFGPPKWSDAKFTLSTPLSMETIKY
jgi:uncharacterized protein (DUF2141 family)